MSTRRNSTIGVLPSGVPGLDAVLGGGLRRDLPAESSSSSRHGCAAFALPAASANRLRHRFLPMG